MLIGICDAKPFLTTIKHEPIAFSYFSCYNLFMNETNTSAPLFETDVVRIDYLTTDPRGISVETRQTLGRSAVVQEFGKPSLTEEEGARYHTALAGEGRFLKRGDYEAARDEHGVTSPEAREQWAAYRTRIANAKKVGLRSTHFDHDTNTLTADVIAVSFPTYKEFAKPGSSPELRAQAENTGNALIVVTRDNKLVIQHRAIEKPHILNGGKARGNALYTDIPGASAAGMFDAKSGDKPGVPAAIETSTVIDSIMKEAGEELGLGAEHLDGIRIVGVAKDKLQPHEEFLLMANTNLTAEEVHQTSRDSNRNKNLDDLDFEEKFMTIEASPAAIRTLLVDVRCPLPPTHTAAMVAAGYSMMLEQQGTDAADAWRAELQTEMNDNVQVINQTVTDYYQRFPEAAKQVPERFWGKPVPARSLEGYSPAYGPEEQGLPNIDDELVRTGLKPETRRQITRAHLFDVDGVLSDPHQKKVIHPELFDELIGRLRAGEPIALNTGRSADWALNNIVEPVSERLGDDKHLLELLSVIGEKGGSWAVHDKEGNLHRNYAEKLTLPDGLVGKVNTLLSEDPEFSATMTTQVDPDKKTMISPEMSAVPAGTTPDEHLARFHRAQDRFAEEVGQLIEENGLSDIFKVDKTTIATDVESHYVGKDLGAERFLEILKAQNIAYKHGDSSAEFVTYGDSGSDIAMAEELQRRGLQGEFVYVGTGTPVRQPGYSFPVNKVNGYSTGTLDYLRRTA
jgi:hypothetical protein